METTRSAGIAVGACKVVEGLTQKQRSICAEAPSLIPIMIQVSGAIEYVNKYFFGY